MTDASVQQVWLAAAEAGDLSSLQHLLVAHPELLNAVVHHKSLKTCSALHVAVWRNRTEAAAFLLAQGADVRQLDEVGMTALQTDLLRVRLERMRDVPLLRSRGSDAHSPVSLAAFKRRLVPDRTTYHELETRTLDLLLAQGVDVNHRSLAGDTALVTAVELGLTKHVTKLLANGADARIQDGHDRTVLDMASENGFVDIIEPLVKGFPDLVVTAGELALTAAIRHDFSEVLDTLYDRLQSTLPQDQRQPLGGRLLQTAVEYCSISSVEYLLGKNAPICWTNERGENAIQVALSGRQPKILDLLLEHQALSGVCLEKRGIPRSGAAVLRHDCTEMEVLGQFEPELNFEDEGFKLALLPTMKPWGLQSMEVLVRHGAHFEFPTRESRDAIASFLAECLNSIAPQSMADVLEDLISCISFDAAQQNVLREVLVALAWSQYTPEVLTLVLLMLFSSRSASPRQALAILEPWMHKFDANVVIQTLLADSLQTRSSRASCSLDCSKKQ